MIETRNMACCGCVEIMGISYYKGDPRGSLIQLLEEYSDNWTKGGVKILNDLPGHIIFTGCVEEDGDKYTYVQEFAAFLRKNKLGRVTLSQTAYNRINHPDHRIMVGIWSPAMTNLQAWWRRLVAPKRE